MAYILALDQGTSSSRAMVFDSNGRHTSLAQKSLTQIFPQPGWVEHNAQEIWSTQLECAQQALSNAGIVAQNLSAIGITNQRETTVLWSKRSGQPIHNAIVWQDRRTTPWCEAQRDAGLESMVRAKTGLMIDPYFSASKIVWLLEHVPGARKLADNGELLFGTVDTWLIWKLTNGEKHVTDVTNASRTLLYNIEDSEWDQDLLQRWNIPANILPEVQVSGSHFGTTALLGGEVPITGVAGDQQAAMFGQGCVQPGQAKNTYGTGCFFMLHTGENSFQSRHGLLTTRTAQVSRLPQYGLEGAVFNTGSLIQWLRDGLGIIQSSNEVETLARSVDHADQVMIVPAFNGLGSPHWDPKARGIIVGLTRGTNKAHLARAALQSIALQVAELVDAMQNDTKLRLEELYVDGGGSVNNLLMQMQADYLGVPVVRPKNVETTAFGAAALAAHTIGIFQYAQRDDMEVDRFEPRLSADAAQAKLAQWRKAVERCKDWVD